MGCGIARGFPIAGSPGERIGSSHRPARRSGAAHHALHGPPGRAAWTTVRRLLRGGAGAAAQPAARVRKPDAAQGNGGCVRGGGVRGGGARWQAKEDGRLAGQLPILLALRQRAVPGRASWCRDACDGLMLGHPGRGAGRHAALLRGRASARTPLLALPCVRAPLDSKRDAPLAVRDVPVPPAYRARDLARVRSRLAGAPRRAERIHHSRARNTGRSGRA